MFFGPDFPIPQVYHRLGCPLVVFMHSKTSSKHPTSAGGGLPVWAVLGRAEGCLLENMMLFAFFCHDSPKSTYSNPQNHSVYGVEIKEWKVRDNGGQLGGFFHCQTEKNKQLCGLLKHVPILPTVAHKHLVLVMLAVTQETEDVKLGRVIIRYSKYLRLDWREEIWRVSKTKETSLKGLKYIAAVDTTRCLAWNRMGDFFCVWQTRNMFVGLLRKI